MKETKEKQKKEQIQKITEEYIDKLKSINGKELGVFITVSDGLSCFNVMEGKGVKVSMGIGASFKDEEMRKVMLTGMMIWPEYLDCIEDFKKLKKEYEDRGKDN